MAESIISHRASRGSFSRLVLAVEPGRRRTIPRASAASIGGFGILDLMEDKKVFQGMRRPQKRHDGERQTTLAVRHFLAIDSPILSLRAVEVRS